MITILVCWMVVGFYAYVYGYTGINIVYKKRAEVLCSIDTYIICGLVLLNLFAQFFSIFYKVGMVAFLIITLGAIVCTVYFFFSKRKGKNAGFRVGEKKDKIIGIKVVLFGIGIAGTLLWTNVVPQHYDTYLYHAQAIHWIEEYGVVPGLGNLHCRLAYNSAFMTLQALFSFSWINGQSLHTVNGFIVVFFLGYFIFSFYKDRENILSMSDLLKLGALLYIIYMSIGISSPNTDLWALLLLFYICIKWCDFSEQQLEGALPYGFLCLLCVYAVTVKLSTAIFVVLAIYPAISFIQKKQWKMIWLHLLAGMVIVIPYFIRNVIISGYLVYPYPEIDLFHFDWKMLEGIVMTDRKEITVWARGNQALNRYNETFVQWFPDWFMSIHIIWRILFVFSIVAGVYLLIKVIKNIKAGKKWNEIALIIACVAGELFWLISAPLPRYGIVYMLFLMCVAIGILFREGQKSISDGLKRYTLKCSKVGGIGFCFVILFYSFFYAPYSYISQWGEQTVIWQNDYADRDTIKEEINGKEVFRAAQGDQTGYAPFPSTPYLGAIEGIELRGENFDNGFRCK